MILRMVIGLVLTVAAFAIAGRRLWWLKRLAFSGQPAPERLEYARANVGTEIKTQLHVIPGRVRGLPSRLPGRRRRSQRAGGGGRAVPGWAGTGAGR